MRKTQFVISWRDADGFGQSIYWGHNELHAVRAFMRDYKFRSFISVQPL